jgi:hypothetical protein
MADANAIQEVKEDQEDKLLTLYIYKAQLAEIKRRIRQGNDITLLMVTYIIPQARREN